jgi:RHS repeat-associated protein
VFDEDSFSPVAKIKGDKQYSILSDYLGTPTHVFDFEGDVIWETRLDSYGKMQLEKGKIGTCPFRYQGQYEDYETGLRYSRYRYYSPDEGIYISQDPINLDGGFEFYEYVRDPNIEYDPFGLKTYNGNDKRSKKKNHLYEIYNIKTGETYKFGISGGKKTAKGESVRANSQRTRIANEAGVSRDDVGTRIVKDNMTRKTALNQEQKAVNNHARKDPDGNGPTFNALPKPTI